MDHNENKVPSPCVNVCYLNDDDVCVGCYRTGHEISQWGRLDVASQQAVMEKVREREAASQFVSQS
ncbi:DUF1289 domain-containing protein [Marinomonas posidonica]|uniref:Fe-S protein n=1 Tax=Marinomonas posidonica (strain CECT 7376 / NCIMB 14433 / IVIA-Po-181) TaxID=491952 RepID=F6CVE0_MARPP|nr:DUF1289 domain-containing protein [Marinomonas posidonica]AEF54250.1 protein of unknown function DUF1289 [Marinomonas posidonica IVIA-Po-181]